MQRLVLSGEFGYFKILIKQAAPASISKRLAFSVPFRKWTIFTRLINHLFYFRKSNEMPTAAKEPIEESESE
jgi:hypothetical protein